MDGRKEHGPLRGPLSNGMSPAASPQPQVSIVIPIFNEEKNISPLLQSLQAQMKQLQPAQTWEIIAVDDGSHDGSLAALKQMQKEISGLRIYSFRRNFGQTAAMAAGFDHARGEVVITLDADRQNDPKDIPRLLEKLGAGFDIVSGWRQNRKDPWLTRRLPSQIANGLISRVTGVRLKDYGCTLKAYRRDVLKDLPLFGDMHRFIPALASWRGVRLAEIDVQHHPRVSGKSKYGLWRASRVVLDLLTVKLLINFRSRPIQLFGPVGLASIISGVGYGLFLSFQRLFLGLHIKPLRPLIVVLLILTGVQLISIGLLGEMIMRVYFEGQRKAIYVIREVLE